jgi:hypothetical protein
MVGADRATTTRRLARRMQDLLLLLVVLLLMLRRRRVSGLRDKGATKQSRRQLLNAHQRPIRLLLKEVQTAVCAVSMQRPLLWVTALPRCLRLLPLQQSP